MALNGRLIAILTVPLYLWKTDPIKSEILLLEHHKWLYCILFPKKNTTFSPFIYCLCLFIVYVSKTMPLSPKIEWYQQYEFFTMEIVNNNNRWRGLHACEEVCTTEKKGITSVFSPQNQMKTHWVFVPTCGIRLYSYIIMLVLNKEPATDFTLSS